MNPKVIGGIVIVIAAAVVAYFLFFSGDNGSVANKCDQSPEAIAKDMEAMQPQLEEAVKKALESDPSKAEALVKQAQAIMEMGQAGKLKEACEATYELAKELGVEVK